MPIVDGIEVLTLTASQLDALVAKMAAYPVLDTNVSHLLTGNGAWLQAPFVNLKDYGAVGDGITDDTAAVQAWLTHGGSLYAPAGTYMVDGDLTGVTGTVILCDGGNSLFKVNDNQNPATIITFGSEAAMCTVEIHGGYFHGNKLNNATGGDGLKIIRGYRANLHHTRVEHCTGNGIVYSGTDSSFENYMVSPFVYRNDGFGIYMTGAGVMDTHVLGGDIGYNALGGVAIATSCSIKNTVIWGGGQPNATGIVFAGVSSQVMGCSIEGMGKYGIDVGTASYNMISGNKIYANSDTSGNSGLYDGIYIAAGADYGTITGNKIYSSLGEAYSMRYAINFAGAHASWTIAGNDMALLAAPGGQKIAGAVVNGILETDKTDNNWILTNVFGALSGNYTATGAAGWVPFPFNYEYNDPLSEFSSSGFVPKNSGKYRIECSLLVVPTAAGENLGMSLFNSGGTEIVRMVFDKAYSTDFQLMHAVIDSWLAAGTTYEIRYWVGSTSTVFLAGYQWTYLKINPIPQ